MLVLLDIASWGKGTYIHVYGALTKHTATIHDQDTSESYTEFIKYVYMTESNVELYADTSVYNIMQMSLITRTHLCPKAVQ